MENIAVLKAEKQELQAKYDYYRDMKSFYQGTTEDILTTVKQQIDRIDSKIQNLQKQTA